MKHFLKQADDLRWLVAHTNGFHGGYITEVQMSKKRLFDEDGGRELLVGTTVTVVVRYSRNEMLCIARLIMNGVSDFSILEQEGEDCSAIGVIQAEASEERLRFWFDPEGQLYVVCEDALYEEIASPAGDLDIARAVACIWRIGRPGRRRASIRWEGELLSASVLSEKTRGSVHVMAHCPAGSSGFGMTLRAPTIHDPQCGQVLNVVADLLARTFPGTCVVGETMLSCDEWLRWDHRKSR